MLATIEPKPLRVLVVDDHSDTVDTTSILLRLIGHKVQTALNGRDAVTCARKFKPQVAMLDLAMPAMDGYQTARELQRLRSPPILLAVSGYTDIQTRRQAAEAGFDLCLTKPIEPGIYEQLQVLVEESERLNAEQTRLSLLREQTQSALKSLAIAHIQTAYTMLHVARTTENETTKARCLAKARRVCDRLVAWTRRYPYLRDLRDDLEDLLRHLPDG